MCVYIYIYTVIRYKKVAQASGRKICTPEIDTSEMSSRAFSGIFRRSFVSVISGV